MGSIVMKISFRKLLFVITSGTKVPRTVSVDVVTSCSTFCKQISFCNTLPMFCYYDKPLLSVLESVLNKLHANKKCQVSLVIMYLMRKVEIDNFFCLTGDIWIFIFPNPKSVGGGGNILVSVLESR